MWLLDSIVTVELILGLYFISSIYCYPTESKAFETEDPITSSEIESFVLTNGTIEKENSDIQQMNDNPFLCTTNDGEVEENYIRNGLTLRDKLWIPVFKFYLDGPYTKPQRRLINVAVQILRQVLPCIKFEELDKPLPESEPHVVVNQARYCGSIVGKTGKRQMMYLAADCLQKPRSILHEFMHALGLHHEQNRPDRDEYVNIFWENIIEEHKINYEKVTEPNHSAFGVKYNKWSVMHYGLYDWTKNNKQTMSFKESNKFAPNEPVSFGPFQNIGLQKSDITKIRKMYGC